MDFHSPSDSVISPSSGSLLPLESSLRSFFFFFDFFFFLLLLCFSDLAFFFFFLELAASSEREPFVCFFLLAGRSKLPLRRDLEEALRREGGSEPGDRRFSLCGAPPLWAARRSTHSTSSSSALASSPRGPCRQTVNRKFNVSGSVRKQDTWEGSDCEASPRVLF